MKHIEIAVSLTLRRLIRTVAKLLDPAILEGSDCTHKILFFFLFSVVNLLYCFFFLHKSVLYLFYNINARVSCYKFKNLFERIPYRRISYAV